MLERSSSSPQARSKAQQAAERAAALYVDQHYVDDAGPGHWENTFLAGVAWALPENPDPAVIESMAKALYLDHGTDRAAATAPEIADVCRRMARAAYAAMRGAVQ